MRREDLLAYLGRDRDLVEQSRAEHWARMRAERGPGYGILIADELRRHARALHPEGPTDEERATDLASHARVAEILSRVGPRRPR